MQVVCCGSQKIFPIFFIRLYVNMMQAEVRKLHYSIGPYAWPRVTRKLLLHTETDWVEFFLFNPKLKSEFSVVFSSILDQLKVTLSSFWISFQFISAHFITKCGHFSTNFDLGQNGKFFTGWDQCALCTLIYISCWWELPNPSHNFDKKTDKNSIEDGNNY